MAAFTATIKNLTIEQNQINTFCIVRWNRQLTSKEVVPVMKKSSSSRGSVKTQYWYPNINDIKHMYKIALKSEIKVDS